MRTLLIGGARSGKSVLAARWSNERSTRVCTVVTGTESDPEMAARIAAHRRERPPHWRVREEPVHLGRALRDAAAPNCLVLLDCLTLWISNCLWPPVPASRDRRGSANFDGSSGADLVSGPASAAADLAEGSMNAAADLVDGSASAAADLMGWRRERDDFLDTLGACTSDVIIVTNEVGTGIVPNNPASRVFRDEQGWLNQAVAAVCDEVFFVTAGLPLCLKPSPQTPGRTTAPTR
jgi:adenosylcobinamide kinase / adenosylcobinamide-phosphate guanylyltransferase